MNNNFFLIFLVNALNLLCHVPSLFASPILGGLIDIHHGFKYHATIHKKKDGTFEYSCGGSIIAERYVLTAAHCFMTKENGVVSQSFDVSNGQAIVLAGSNRLTDVGIEKEIIRVFIPSDYHTTSRRLADIAVAQLKEDLGVAHHRDVMEIIPMIPLPPTSAEINKEAVFCGFGVSAVGKNSQGIIVPRRGYSELLRYLKITILGTALCTVYENFICGKSKTPIQTACYGDSGAGLVVDGYVVGVLSRGPPNCDANIAPILFTRLYQHTTFIQQAKNEHGDHSKMHVLGEHPGAACSSSSSGSSSSSCSIHGAAPHPKDGALLHYRIGITHSRNDVAPHSGNRHGRATSVPNSADIHPIQKTAKRSL